MRYYLPRWVVLLALLTYFVIETGAAMVYSVTTPRRDILPQPTPPDTTLLDTALPRKAGSRTLQELADAAAHLCGVTPALLHALVARESSWNPAARSRSGAVGLGQLMPAAAEEMGVTDRRDPWQNLLGSACYLRKQYDRFGTWREALHAYHAGANRTHTSQVTKDYASDIVQGAN